MSRPNILFLMSDEHRPDVAGYAGDPVVRTPALDELARTASGKLARSTSQGKDSAGRPKPERIG